MLVNFDDIVGALSILSFFGAYQASYPAEVCVGLCLHTHKDVTSNPLPKI